MQPTTFDTKTEERLPWHKPQMERLIVSMDTAGGSASGPDLEDGSLVG